MRLAHLSADLAGETLARTVLGSDYQVLLVAGVRLTPRYIQQLRARGVQTVYLVDDLSEAVVPEAAVQLETREHAAVLVRHALARAEANDPQGLPLAELEAVLNEILEELWRNQGLAVDLGEIRRSSPYTFGHAVDCTVLALVLGQARGLPAGHLRLLGTGVMLMDIGMAHYGHLVSRPGALSPQEFAELQAHTERGFQFLRKEAGLPLLAAHVAYQHHERQDGSGYPRGLYAEDIHLFGRMAAVTDVFDALRSDRPFKLGMPAADAMGVLRALGENKLDGDLVRLLSQRVAVYATGTPVLLTSGELGVVLGQTAAGGAPLVRVVADPSLRVVTPFELDLGADIEGRGVRTVLPDYPREVLQQLHYRG